VKAYKAKKGKPAPPPKAAKKEEVGRGRR